MFHIITDIREDAQRLSNLSKRNFNKKFKQVLKEAVQKWHKEMLPEHFKRSAYSKYPNAFKGKRKGSGKGKPLVKTGSLRKHLKKKIDISGTATRVRGRMKYGRPGNPSKKQLRAEIFAIMFSRRISYQQAGRVVGSENSYSKQSVEFFKSSIPIVNEQESEVLRKFVLDEILKYSKPTKKTKKRRIR